MLESFLFFCKQLVLFMGFKAGQYSKKAYAELLTAVIGLQEG